MAITTFALHRAAHTKAGEAFTAFRNMNRTDEHLYWSAVEIPKNPSSTEQTRIVMEVREKDETQGQALRATCYGLMLFLERINEGFEFAKPIVSWIRTQPNALFGWDSTQDTLLVMEVRNFLS